MTHRVAGASRVIVGLALVFALTLMLGAAPANAGTRLGHLVKIQSVEWQPRTGDILVTARVGCVSPDGREFTDVAWGVFAEQRTRAKAAETVSCTGEAYLSTLVLSSRHGRFTPGEVYLQVNERACRNGSCYSWYRDTRASLSGS